MKRPIAITLFLSFSLMSAGRATGDCVAGALKLIPYRCSICNQDVDVYVCPEGGNGTCELLATFIPCGDCLVGSAGQCPSSSVNQPSSAKCVPPKDARPHNGPSSGRSCGAGKSSLEDWVRSQAEIKGEN